MPRIPVAVNLESRDGSTAKDGHAKNCVIEVIDPKARKKKLRKRPGCSDYGLVRAGIAQLLVYWNGIKTVIGDYFSSGIDVQATYINTTWNPSDKSASVNLSGGNLTATATASGTVRSILGCSTGNWQFEYYVDSSAANIVFGMANNAYDLATGLGKDAFNSIGYRNDGTIKAGNSIIATVATCGFNDFIDILFDADNRTISFYKNGTFLYQATGANVPSGTLYAALGFDASVSPSFIETAFSGTNFPVSQIVSTTLSPTIASLPFSAQSNGANAGTDYLMFKNATQAWTLAPSGNPTLITDADYPGISTVNVTGITRSGTTATATTPADTNFQVGSAVTIAGAVQADYNGVHTITAVTSSATVPEVAIPITITRSGTTATATSTTQPHGFINGQVVPIRGANQDEYNGSKTITWISATQFSFTVTVTGTDISSPAGGTPIINPYSMFIRLVNTAGALTTWAGTYYSPADQGSLVNGQTFTIADYGLGICTVSGASMQGFTLTSTGWNPGVQAQIVVTAIPTSPTISSITAASNLATATTSAAHNYSTGKQITISGATPIVYNGLVTITVTGSTTFTYMLPGTPASPVTPATGVILAGDAAVITGASFSYSVANSPATPATGTITASGGRNTVPGIAYINGYFIVMDVNGVIYNSNSDKPAIWDALDYTIANNIPGAGVALARSADYIIAFKEWSTEPYYDAKNPTGSPLSPYESGRSLIGCANGWSVAEVDGSLFWIAQVKAQGRSVYAMSGIQQTKVSTPDVERILNADDLATVHAYGLKVDGHALYVVTLVSSNLTLVYDLGSHHWYLWTSYTIAASKSVTSITLSGTTATVTTSTAHGIADGEPVTISGAVQTGYNGIWQTRYVSPTVFTIEVAAGLVTPATGTILAYPYTESYFKFSHYADCDGVNLMLHESDGHLYEIDSGLARDAGIPINYLARSQRLDGNTSRRKTMGRITIIGDAVDDTAMVRWSDDDYVSSRPYRIVDLAAQKQMVRQCGAFVDRSIEIKHIGNTRPVWDEVELEIQ